VLDPAVAIAQQPERLIESVVGPLADLDEHVSIAAPEAAAT
jgi:hypothetical protein